VVRSLRRAIAGITQQTAELGGHLEEAVRTGRYCIYLPEPAAALSWTVEVWVSGGTHRSIAVNAFRA
jgi:hypothetical protein